MQQDLQQGKIELAELTVDPDLTETSFLSQCPDAPAFVHNDPHRSYSLPRIELSDRAFLPTIWFSSEKLTALNLTFDNPAMKSWDDYSEAAEKIVQSDNANWAGRYFGVRTPAQFPWGSIASILDPKGGRAFIWISYR